jgi:hypothetical protein
VTDSRNKLQNRHPPTDVVKIVTQGREIQLSVITVTSPGTLAVTAQNHGGVEDRMTNRQTVLLVLNHTDLTVPET